jgi:hypothetical protein
VVCEGTGGGDFAEETILLVSALGLWGESAWANGGENGSLGAGGMEKRRLWAALQVEGLKRGGEGVFADQMRLGLLGQVRRVWRRRGEK